MELTNKNSLLHERSVARALTWRYVIALCLVASLSTAAWLSLHMVISAQKSTAAVVNVSGRQRMLSQRTAFFSYMLANSPKAERPLIRGKLNDAIQLMEKSHQGLIHGDSSMGLPSTLSPAVHAMYFDPPDALDTQVRAYVKAVQELIQLPDDELTLDATQLKYITRNAPTILLTTLDRMVNQYQLEGEASVSQLQKAETVFWCITLLLLALEAALIFRPFTRHVGSVIGKLESTTEALKMHEGQLEEEVRKRTSELEEKSKALADSKEALRQIAYYDSLTGLPNRRMLNDRLDKAIALSKRTDRYGALIFIDLDNFKLLNDTYGHAAGDSLLVEVAHRLIKGMREMDTVARFGGDEFVVMLCELEKNESEAISHALTVAEKILATLNEPYELDIVDATGEKHITHLCSGSIGVAMFARNDISKEDLLQFSDTAMYRAKEAGKNMIRLYD